MNRRDLLGSFSAVGLLTATRVRGAAPGVVAIDALLEPDSTLAERARALNARLRATHPRGFAFDATHVPHISLVQQFVRQEDIARVGPVIAKALEGTPAPQRLDVTGMDVAPWNGQAMVSLRIEPTAALLHLQAALVAALIPLAAPAGDAAAFVRDPPETDIDGTTIAYVSSFVLKQAGDKFQPHVTVGMTTTASATALKNEPFAPETFGVNGVAVYQLGNAGTARRRLWPSGG